MNKSSLFLLLLLIFVSSCSKQDGEAVATCIDGVQNGNETGIDCGGDCTPCTVT